MDYSSFLPEINEEMKKNILFTLFSVLLIYWWVSLRIFVNHVIYSEYSDPMLDSIIEEVGGISVYTLSFGEIVWFIWWALPILFLVTFYAIKIPSAIWKKFLFPYSTIACGSLWLTVLFALVWWIGPCGFWWFNFTNRVDLLSLAVNLMPFILSAILVMVINKKYIR